MINDKTKEKYLHKKFNKLYVKDIYKKSGINYCLCSCECGNDNYHIRSTDLKNSKSCGCVKSNNGKLKINCNTKKLMLTEHSSNNYGEFIIEEYINKKMSLLDL